ncbi:MAG: hypothetical protein FJW40_01160 [Acidobacteria bacterium]|nr:hypothetical protein [Acidobacteriota bacterium]
MPSRFVFAAVFSLGVFAAQEHPRHEDRKDVKLPNGKSQTEEILKEEHKKSLEDARELIRLAEELKTDLDKNDRHIVSVAMVKRLEEMEKRVKRIRGRLTRY